MSSSSGLNPFYQLTPDQVNRAESAQWRTIIKQALADTRGGTPGFLTKDLDVATQTVTVQVAIQEWVRTQTGPEWWDIPAIIMVPVVMPRGGGYSVTLPLKKGDEGLVVFCDTCFDLWWQNGQTNAPTADNTLATAKTAGVTAQASGSQRQLEIRRHYIHDCMFIPGVWNQKRLLTNYSTASLQIRSDDGSTVIDISSTNGIAITATNNVQITAPGVKANANSGTPLALVNDNFYQWFVTTYMPSVQYVSTPPPLPVDPETTILKGQ
jgi:hypothetical protein